MLCYVIHSRLFSLLFRFISFKLSKSRYLESFVLRSSNLSFRTQHRNSSGRVVRSEYSWYEQLGDIFVSNELAIRRTDCLAFAYISTSHILVVLVFDFRSPTFRTTEYPASPGKGEIKSTKHLFEIRFYRRSTNRELFRCNRATRISIWSSRNSEEKSHQNNKRQKWCLATLQVNERDLMNQMADNCDVAYVALSEPEVSVNTYNQEVVDVAVAQSLEGTSNSASTVIEIEDDNTTREEPELLPVDLSPSKILGTPEKSSTVVEESGPNSLPSSEPEEQVRRAIADNLPFTLEAIIGSMNIEMEHSYTTNGGPEPELRTVVKSSQTSTVKKSAKSKKKQKVNSNFKQAQERPQHERTLRERKVETKKRSTNFAKKQRAKKKRKAESTPTYERELRGNIASRTPVVSHKRERRSLDIADHEFKVPSSLTRRMEANGHVSAVDFLALEYNSELNKSPRLPAVDSKTYMLCALIGEALLSSERGQLSTNEIADFISHHYPKYNLRSNRRLKSLFSDVLSRKPYFLRIGKKSGEKTHQWRIEPSYLENIKEMIVQRGILNGEASSESEVRPHECFVDATVIKDDISIHESSSRLADNEKETNESTSINPIEIDDNVGLLDASDENRGRMPEVFSYCSSASSSFPIQTAIESISQQECRESPPATDTTLADVSLVSEDEDIIFEEKVTTIAQTTVLELECPLCDEIFSSNESLGSHMAVHSKRRRLTAPPAASLPTLPSNMPGPSVSPVNNSLVVSSSNDDRQVAVANAPTRDPSGSNPSEENMRRALNSLPSSLFEGQRPIIFLGNVYFNHS